MSALLQQLQHLKVAGQPSSLHVAVKKRPSLLFDHEQAAELDIEVIYDLGRNGLEELTKLDNSLSKYEENLFSEKCMEYERSIQGKEQLQQLDDTIGNFLRQLSPYLMLRAAHKCLEWLIRAFRINSYNIGSIMECTLPYHDTILFARILQLLPLKSKSSCWHWLRPAQKKGSPLAKATLIQHCISVPSFLSFICNMIERCNNRIVVNFYCSTMIGVLNATAVVEESLVVMVMPHITNGVKSSHDHIKAANYIILAHMIQHATLSDKVSNSLLNLLTKNLSVNLLREGIMLLCHYCSCQQLNTLSSRSVKHLTGCPQLLPTLSDLGGSHDLSTFGGLLIKSLITSHFDKMMGSHGDQVPSPDVIVGVVKAVPLEEAIIVQCMRSLLQYYMKYRDVIGQVNNDDTTVLLDNLQHYCEPIIKAIDIRYPSVVDIVIGDHLTSCDPRHQKWSQDFVALSLPSVKHHVVMDTGVVTAVGIHHGNPNVRAITLSKLCQQSDNEQHLDTEDNEFVSSAVLSHLHDDNNLVVENVVSCCIQQKRIVQNIPVESLIDALFSVLSRARSHDPISDQCLQNAISLLISVDQFTDNMLLRLLPYLLYHYHDDVKVIQSLGVAIATSSLAQTHPLLVGSDKMFCSQDYQIQSGDCDTMNNANCYLIGYFAEILSSMDTQHLTNMVTLLLDMCHHDDNISPSLNSSFLFSVAMVTVLLMHSIPQSLNIKISNNLVSMVSSIMSYCVITENITPSLENAISLLVHKRGSQRKQAKFLGNLVSWIITMVTKHLVIISDIKASLWLDMRSCDPTEYQQYCMVSEVYACGVELIDQVLLILYNLLIQLLSNSQWCVDNCRSVMKTFINIHFQGRGTLLRFLAMIWCAESNMDASSQLSSFNLCTQISSLQYTLVFLDTMGPGAVLAVGGVPQCPMVPALLVALLKPDKSLRQAALKCFQLIHTSINVTGVDIMNVNTPFLYLCDVMLHHQVELEADHNAVVVAMAKGMNTVTMVTKQSIITAIVKALMYHVTSRDAPTHIQCSLLTVISNVYHKVKFDGVVKMLKRSIPLSSDNQEELIEKLIKCYNINNIAFITCDAINVLTRLLNTTLNLVLQQLTGEFYSSLKIQYQQLILSVLLDCCLDTDATPTASAAIVNVINKLPLDINNVLHELNKKELLKHKFGSRKSKRIKLDTPTEEEILDKSWQRVAIVLDAVPGCVSSQECYQLVPILFELLESCLELGTTPHHIQLQLLNVLCWIVTMTMAHVGAEKTRALLPETQFNIDMIVQTIRSSSSTPQIQQQSLSLLSVSAALYPVRILHNIMSIFTFMGVYISNHDDQYSFEIVLTAMDSLLPMLMSSDSHKKSSNQIAVTAVEIIRVFSDAVEHIPDHRQLIVFEKLVNILGVEDHLHVTLLMLLGKQVTKQQQDNQQKKIISEFCKQLSNRFPIVMQVMSLHKIVEYISHLPDVPSTRGGSVRKVAMVTTGEIFNLCTHSTKQIQQYKLSALSSVISVLSCEQFTNKLVHNGISKEQEMMFLSLLQTTISYIVTINAHHNDGKFYDLLIKRCYTIVDHVTHPLTTKSYMKVMSQLIMPGAQVDLQRRSLDIICTHFTSLSQHFATSNVKDTLTLLPLLSQLIQHKQSPVDNKISAILLVTTITQSVGSGYHDNIIEVMSHLLKIIKKKSTPNRVLACSIECISKMIKNIGGYFIPHLPDTLPLLIAKVSSHDNTIATVATEGLISVIEVLPKFLTPYISDIIMKACRTVVAIGDHATLATATKHLREQVTTHIPSRMLMPTLVQCYDQVVAMDTTQESVLSFLHILHMSINKLSISDVGSHSNELTDLFIKLLQYRSFHHQEAVDVEDKCIKCFTDLVVKMSENVFRPVFLKISDWAIQSKNKDHIISFYHLADQIAGKLKGLFLLFVGHIIPNCVELLENMNDDDDDQLQQYLLPCLTKCFHYDTTNSFLTTNRFNALLEPLATQVHHITDDDMVHKYLVPCMVEFAAAAAAADTQWKALNHKLLLYSKDDDCKVRKSILHILTAMYNKLGESLLILLPETIPFLAELLEDEDEEVEQLCQKFIKVVEQLLGESIQQYF